MTHWRDPERLLDVAELLEQVTDRRHVDAVPPMAQTTPVYEQPDATHICLQKPVTCSGR